MNRADREPRPERPNRQSSAAGILIAGGTIAGTIAGLFLGEISAGTVAGFFAGCALAVITTLAQRR